MPTTTTTSSSSSSSWSSHPINRSRPDSARKVDDAMKASNGSSVIDATNNDNNKEKAVAYRECRKNHAASIGGYAVDGCREFMASGAEGTAAALRCAACGCHRSFHRREVVVLAAAAEPHASSDCSSNSNS